MADSRDRPELWEKKVSREDVRSWTIIVWCLVWVMERALVGFKECEVSIGTVSGWSDGFFAASGGFAIIK